MSDELSSTITWDEFTRVELRVGRIVSAEEFPEARKPAYVLQVDFGETIGMKKSSAQVTHLYTREELVGRLVVAVVNFPKKQIGPLMSECLVTGFHDAEGHVALCVPDRPVPVGTQAALRHQPGGNPAGTQFDEMLKQPTLCAGCPEVQNRTPKLSRIVRGVVYAKRFWGLPKFGPKSQFTPLTGVVVNGLNAW